MATRRKTSKRTRAKKKTIIDKSEMSLCEYMSQIDAFDKLKFYDEVYKKFMERLEIKDKTRADYIEKTARDLAAKKEYRMILYIFQRIVPTLCDSEPVKFLQQAIKEADNGDLDSLCVFLQIAGFRWTLIEKSYKRSKKSRNGRNANKWWNKEEYKYLRPLFEEEPGVIKEEFKQKFIIGYRKFIVDWLIENWEKLDSILKEIRKNIIKNKECINRIIDKYNQGKNKDVEELIRKTKVIQDFYRNRYDELVEYQNEEKVFFDSVNQSFRLSELRETVWMELPEWPLQLVKKEYFIKDFILREMNEEDKLDLIQDKSNGIIDVEVIICEEDKKQQTAKEDEKQLEPKDERKDLTPEEKVQLYETLYSLCMRFIEEEDYVMFSIIDKAEKKISNCPGLGMVLYMFKRIVPTLCDCRPIYYLLASLEDSFYKHDYTGLCMFMQIASFRWGIIESDYLLIRDLNYMNLKRSFLCSPKARFVVQSFAELKKKSNDEYNVDSFNQWFDKVLAKEIAKEWNLLLSWLNERIKKNSKWKEISGEICEAHDSNNTEKIARMITRTEEIRRYFRDQYKNTFKPHEVDSLIYVEPFKKYFFASDLKKTLLKKMEPWVILDRPPIDVLFYTPEDLFLLEESIRIQKFEQLL